MGYILSFIGRFLLSVLLLFALFCDINCQSNVYMKNKILLLGLFCCSLISTEAQVLLDKGTGKNSFPIVSSSTNAVVCFDGKDATVVRKSASLLVDDVRRVTGVASTNLSMSSNSFLGGTRAYIWVVFVGVSQHLTDGLDRYPFLERNQRGERMPSHVVDKVLADPRHQTQGFHVGSERVVVLRREERGAGIVTVLLDQRKGFRQQLDASEVAGLLPSVFQPEAASVIREEVLPGDAYRIGIGGAGVTGEKEEVPGDDMRPAFFRYLQITQLLEILTAQCPRRTFLLLGQLEVAEMVFLRMSLLVGDAADLFQDGQVAAKRVHGIPLFQEDEILVVTDELLVELSEGKIRDLEPRFDEFGERAVGEEVGRERGRRTVHAHTRFHLLIVPVEKFEQGHLRARVTLEQVPYGSGIEISLPFHEGIEGRVYGKQQPLYFFIGLHRFPALAVQSALTRVP